VVTVLELYDKRGTKYRRAWRHRAVQQHTPGQAGQKSGAEVSGAVQCLHCVRWIPPYIIVGLTPVGGLTGLPTADPPELTQIEVMIWKYFTRDIRAIAYKSL
jgi:hypothetical protein